MTSIGVIGVGTMGSNHVRVLSSFKGVEISISDLNKERCKSIADNYKIKSYYFNHEDMLKKEKLDGIIIASPSVYHKKLFLDCVNYGIGVLVEKPIAETIEDAKLMIEKAKKKKIVFTVGHIERFNPIVGKIKSLIKDLGDIYLVNSVRAGPFPKRLYGSPGGVLLDLAVHDADIIKYLLGKIKEVYAKTIKTVHQDIYAKAIFTINNKIIGSSEFSWVSPKRVRTIDIYGTNGMLRGDYGQQNLWFYENPDSYEIQNTKNLFEEILLRGNISGGKVIKYPVKKEEPLKLELENFIESLNDSSNLIIKPEDSLEALNVALSIIKSGTENKVIKIGDNI